METPNKPEEGDYPAANPEPSLEHGSGVEAACEEAPTPSEPAPSPRDEGAALARQHTQKPSKKFVDEDSKSPEYKSDDWRMKHFKVIPCSKRFAHDWTVCPFAHPGEKARRRDPATHDYAGIACPDMKRGGVCPRGEQCKYAHNVFEYWMHPSRYRTQHCNDGANCQRHACFFAHTPDEIRCTPLTKATALAERNQTEPSPDGPNFLGPSYSLPSRESTMSHQRSPSLSPEDLRAHREWLNAQDMTVNFGGGGRDDDRVATMAVFADLLRGAEGPHGGLAAGSAAETNSPAYQAKVMEAIKSLQYNEVQLLLKMAGDQMNEVMSRQRSDPPFMLHDRLGQQQDTHLPSLHGLNVPNKRNLSALHTAPAGLDQFMTQNSMFGSQTGLEDPLSLHRERLLSADLANLSPQPLDSLNAYNGVYNNQNLSQILRQQQANNAGRLGGHLSEVTRAPSTNIIARMGQQDASQYSLSYPQPDELYKNQSASSHNAAALRNQLFSLDDVSTQSSLGPRQHSTTSRNTPVPSAFQPVATQDWQSLPGRGAQNDLDWRLSGNLSMPSTDLREHSYISEDTSLHNPLQTHSQSIFDGLPQQWRGHSTSFNGQGEGDLGLSNSQQNSLLQSRSPQVHSATYNGSSAFGHRSLPGSAPDPKFFSE